MSSYGNSSTRFSTVFGSYCSQVVPKFFTSRLLRELHSHTAGLISNICLYTRVLALPIMGSEGETLER